MEMMTKQATGQCSQAHSRAVVAQNTSLDVCIEPDIDIEYSGLFSFHSKQQIHTERT